MIIFIYLFFIHFEIFSDILGNDEFFFYCIEEKKNWKNLFKKKKFFFELKKIFFQKRKFQINFTTNIWQMNEIFEISSRKYFGV